MQHIFPQILEKTKRKFAEFIPGLPWVGQPPFKKNGVFFLDDVRNPSFEKGFVRNLSFNRAQKMVSLDFEGFEISDFQV